MTSKDTPIHQFLFPEGMSDAVRAKLLPRATATAFLPNVGSELQTAVQSDVGNTTTAMLAMTPMDIIVQGWKRYREVGRALEDSRKKPTDPILKALLKHTIKSTHKPYVEIFLDDVSVGKVTFDLLISFDMEGVTLKILNGEIVSIMSGSFQGAIKLSLVGETLGEVKTKRIDLPGTLRIVDTDATQPTQRKPSPLGAHLSGLTGDSAGQSFLLADGQTIGRGADNSIVIEDKTISRQHARIRYINGQWNVQDMGSASGVFVNDEKVESSPLKEGDRLRLGMSEFEFRN